MDLYWLFNWGHQCLSFHQFTLVFGCTIRPYYIVKGAEYAGLRLICTWGNLFFIQVFSLLRRQPGAAKKRHAWPCFKGCIVWLYCHVVYFIYFKTAGNPKIQRKFTFIGGVFLLHYSHGFLHPAFPGAGGLLL